jgi:hypothetical protein
MQASKQERLQSEICIDDNDNHDRSASILVNTYTHIHPMNDGVFLENGANSLGTAVYATPTARYVNHRNQSHL